MKNLLICSILILTISCNTTKSKMEADTTTTLSDGAYTVSTIRGENVSSEKLTLVVSEEGQRISGFSGCNSYFGAMNVESSDRLFSEMGATKKLCQSAMGTEKSFLNSLQTVSSITKEGSTLNLKNTNGETVIVLKK
ncbi:hypothetical protein SCB49_04560 [unidentified eubacterium SCB49]|nr:hypothetical protein SCB49_04560 [unidentified eubacterium SCB49]